MSATAVPILMYHKVAPVNGQSTLKGHYVSPELFGKQMRALRKRGFEAVPLDRLFQEPLPERPIVITFDDGYENFYSHALPILQECGFSATVFLVANLLGQTNQWDVRNGDVEERLMTVEQIRQAMRSGIDFGSHTLDHADLATADDAAAWEQISGSRQLLESRLDSPIKTFCYPYGRKTASVQAMVARAGYTVACSTEKGANTPATDPFALKRINVRSDSYLPIFLYKLRRDLARA